MTDPNEDMTLAELKAVGISNDVAAVLFATEFDASISRVQGMMRQIGFTEADNDAIIERAAVRLVGTGITPPSDLPVSECTPWVEISDLVTLGALTHAWIGRLGSIGAPELFRRIMETLVEKERGDQD